jgi:hypothetical protein
VGKVFFAQVKTMNIRNCILVPLAFTCLGAIAQDTTDRQTAVYSTAEGELIVHSSQPAARPAGPPPAFAELDRRGVGYLSSEDAAAYPLLANDFIYADSNRDGRISRAEYERWARTR